jgi:hypothetical protein
MPRNKRAGIIKGRRKRGHLVKPSGRKRTTKKKKGK